MKKLLFFITILLFTHHYSVAQDIKPIKILAIGNSFSEDALENYLYDLAKNANRPIIIGNLYIGGAPLELHVKNALADNPAYAYRKITIDGTKKESKGTSISQAIKDEQWDYISLQQSSSLSGQYNTIEKDLPQLISYVNGLKSTNTKLVYHQTWAYQQDSNHKGFSNYDRDQLKMYKAIISVTQKINSSREFAFIAPCGTAIQNARTSSIGDKFTRDGYHLNLAYGRFTAACAWYEKLFGLDVRKNTYKPSQLTDLESKIAKQAAHKAVKKPFKISKIKL